MPYEQGMSIQCDETPNKMFKIIVTFRGQQVELLARYKTDVEGRLAGERYCRELGWRG